MSPVSYHADIPDVLDAGPGWATDVRQVLRDLTARGPIADRPAPGVAGRTYWADDRDRGYKDDGADWRPLDDAVDVSADGTTDDIAVINDEIDRKSAAGGGDVILPPGRIAIGAPIVWKPGVHLVAAGGAKATTLGLIDGSDCRMIESEGFDDLTGSDDPDGIFQCSLRGFSLDGNRTSQAGTEPAIAIYGYDFALADLRLYSARGTGIVSEWASDAAAPGGDDHVSMEANVRNLKVTDCGQHGVHWQGPHDSQWDALIAWENSQQTSHGFSGVVVEGNGGGLQAVNSHLWGGQHFYALYVKAAGVMFANSIAEGAYSAQVVLGANDCVWDGQVYAVPTTATAFLLGVGGSSAGGCRIRGKSITAQAVGSTAGRVVYFFNTAGGNVIDLTNYETAAGSPISGSPAASDAVLIRATGGGGSLVDNFLGGAAPTVTGSRGGNAALASLLTKLADAGIIVDSTS